MPRPHDLNLAARRSLAGRSLAGLDVDVIVLTTDADLLAILHDASGPDHILWHAQSADEAVELLVGGHCGVFIADLQLLGSNAAALLERLQQQFPELVLLAMGRRDEESSIGTLVTSGRVYRFLHKPVSPARASVFIAAAARRHIELSTATSPALAAVRQLTQPEHRKSYLRVGIAIAGIAVLWWQWDAVGRLARNFIPPTTTTPPARSTAAPPLADAAKKQAVDALEQQLIEALRAGDTPRAATAFSALQKTAPEHPRLEQLRAQLLALSRRAKP